MTTTIQVSDATKQVLDSLKKKEKADSYDQIIQELTRVKIKVPQSMFGSVKFSRPWSREDRMDFDNE